MATASTHSAPDVIKRLTVASTVPILMMLVAVVMKPPWRDEFWTLYLTDPSAVRPFSLAGLHLDTSHPPLYHLMMYAWRWLSPDELWARGLSLVWVAIGAFAVTRLWRGRSELVWFLLICAGSYWIIYFAAETRPYTLLFALCAASVFVAARALESQANMLGWAAIWCMLGAILGLTHYFGALWMSCLGFCVGLSFLLRGSLPGFLAWGAASATALVPVALWIAGYSHVSSPFVEASDTLATAFTEGSVQFLRGLVVKLVGSNVALSAAAIVGSVALFRRNEPIDRALAGAAVLTVVIAFAVQLSYAPIIKERAFIVIMPALILLAARAITSIESASVWGWRFLRTAPYVAAITPFLFIPEYFKDREELGEAVAFLRAEGKGCGGAPILAYLRDDDMELGLHRWLAERVMEQAADGAPPPVLINANSTLAENAPAPSAACKIRAVAFLMPRTERPEHADARATLRRAGVPLDELEEHRFGKMRQLVYTER